MLCQTLFLYTVVWFFVFIETATTEIYTYGHTLSLHDALPIYWVATSAETIYAQPSTLTGSIGVFAIIPTFSETLEKAGIAADGVRSTPYSGEPDILRGLSPQVKQLLQIGRAHV